MSDIGVLWCFIIVDIVDIVDINIINLKFTRQNVMQFVKSSLAKMRFAAYTISLLILLILIVLLLHKSSTINCNMHFNCWPAD